MATFDTEHLRNVVLLSHGGAGKTMLTESMAHLAGVTTRLGSTEDGTTTSDYEEEEIKRGTSIQTSLVPCTWIDHKINVIDTPGYADFRGEVVSGIRVADSAIIAVAGPAGVEVGTQQMWRMADERSLPRMIVVTKLDRENSDFQRAVDSIVERFGRECVPIHVPIGAEESFSGAVNLLDPDAAAPEGMEAQVEAARERLIEAVAESDDELADKYLEGEPLSADEISRGLKAGVVAGNIVPVLAGAASSAIGASELLDAIVDLMPSPAETPAPVATDPSSEEEVELSWDPKGPLAALVFKTSADPFVGKLSYFRVYSGAFNGNAQVWDANRGESERVAQAFVISGKSQDPVDELAPGDIGGVAKLASVLTGDTLSVKEKPLTLPGLEFPSPVYNMAAYPKTKADLDKMTSALARIAEEDPSLQVSREANTLELLLGGLGDTHVGVAVEKMKRKFGVDIMLETPKVPYMETIGSTARVEYRHKKQSGGHGQFAHVWLELEPLPRGGGFEFGSKVVGGSVPREYIPAVEKGVQKAMTGGAVAGYPVVDLKATLFDGSFHPVDSSGVSFEIAGGHALSDGMKEASPTVLEPVMHARILVPESDTGDVMGDLNGRRARILGMIPEGGGVTLIEAEVPQSEMLRYATDLRSATQGRGSFTMEFDHYDPVPAHLVSRIVDQKEQDREKADLGDAPGRANTSDKMMTLVASALAGGDCIDDADVLRTGGTACTLGGTVKAPSTLGTFLRSFRWGHVRQLDRVSRELLARAWQAGAGPGDGPLTIDLDSTICETYGLAKEGARHHGYTGKRGYHPLLAIAAGTGDVLMSRLREGRANTARGAAHFLRETVGRVRYAGANGRLTLRADSGFYTHGVVSVCRKMDVRFSITIRQHKSLHNLIEAIPEDAWTPIPYWMDGAADVAETTCTPFQAEADAAPVRLIVRRVKPTPGSQLALFAKYSYHGFITDRDGELLELEADHRRHAEIENAIRDLKYGVGLNHLPSGRFAANGAWLAVQTMAHNLARWTARIGLGERIATTKTLRRRFFSLAGRLTRSARRLTLHLPDRWPWAEKFSRALARLRAIPLPA